MANIMNQEYKVVHYKRGFVACLVFVVVPVIVFSAIMWNSLYKAVAVEQGISDEYAIQLQSCEIASGMAD